MCGLFRLERQRKGQVDMTFSSEELEINNNNIIIQSR